MRISRVSTWTYILLVCALVLSAGCPRAELPPDEDERAAQELLIEFEHNLVVPSSVLRFRMRGSDRLVPSSAEVSFAGATGDGRPIEATVRVQPPEKGFPRMHEDHGDVLVDVPVQGQLWAEIDPSPDAVFSGQIEVQLVDEIGVLARGTLEEVILNFRSDVPPTVAAVPDGTYFVNEDIEVAGENFLRPEEGTTWAIVDGTFTPLEGQPRTISQARLPMRWIGRRDRANFHIDPGVFGVALGSFEGSLRFENELSTGTVFPGNTQPQFRFDIQQTFLAAISPEGGSRGQRITFTGRGFVGTNADAGYGMILRFSGSFAYDSGGELNLSEQPLETAPDRVFSDEEAELAVWYEIEDGRMHGLGANPGTFTGTITPELFDNVSGGQIGLPWEGVFRVLPTKQVVYIKYLPGFSKGLEKYGLHNVEFEIRQRILEVTNRDYASVNVEFQDTPPTDFIDYATVEIGGPDPTGGGKFGYDNTCNVQSEKCKDTDNLYLADYLGGINRNSADEFNTPYGGVFIESFDSFSPTLNPDNEDAAPEFDRILGPFMPALGGTPVKGTEWPGGERHEAIAEAIHMVGSVIGNTVTHEIGHSVGLAFYASDRLRPGEAFHNKLPGDNFIMDPGSQRPFVERGEIDGAGPPIFNQRNLEYLEEILPLSQ